MIPQFVLTLEQQYINQVLSESDRLRSVNFQLEEKTILLPCKNKQDAWLQMRYTFAALFDLCQKYEIDVCAVEYKWSDGQLRRSLLDNRHLGLTPTKWGLRG
jgi:hypothetical protein